jgi:hypothetical protein
MVATPACSTDPALSRGRCERIRPRPARSSRRGARSRLSCILANALDRIRTCLSRRRRGRNGTGRSCAGTMAWSAPHTSRTPARLSAAKRETVGLPQVPPPLSPLRAGVKADLPEAPTARTSSMATAATVMVAKRRTARMRASFGVRICVQLLRFELDGPWPGYRELAARQSMLSRWRMKRSESPSRVHLIRTSVGTGEPTRRVQRHPGGPLRGRKSLARQRFTTRRAPRHDRPET